MDKIKIRKGLNIHIEGEAAKQLENFEPKYCALKPTDFIGVLPKLHVAEGDDVKIGSVLFHDKNNEKIVFTSPISGKVKAIVRGEKRAILEVIVEKAAYEGFTLPSGRMMPQSFAPFATVSAPKM